jgi:hypothetical protein
VRILQKIRRKMSVQADMRPKALSTDFQSADFAPALPPDHVSDSGAPRKKGLPKQAFLE